MEYLEVILLVALSIFAWYKLKPKGRKLPPGPYPLPIIGNILQLPSTNAHETFAQLSKKYGPLMSLHLGSALTIIVSSPEMAKEILPKQAFMDRPTMQVIHVHDHDKLSVGFIPSTDPKWKELRRVCQEQIFSNHNLEKSQSLRHQKLQQLMDYVQKFCDEGRAVNVREAGFTTTLNLMSVTMFSTDASDFDSSVTTELHELIVGVTILLGTPNLADYFPILKYLDPQGVNRKAVIHYGKLLEYMRVRLDRRLEERRANPDRPKPADLLDKLLDIAMESDYKLGFEDMLHLLVDLYIAGSESTIMTIEWSLVELLKKPHTLAKAKEELRNVLGDRKMLRETEDIPKLPYLQGIVKEVLRLHPPGPLLFPRKSIKDMEVNGYFIPKDTQIIINAWGMGRDPTVWPNPEVFDPERYFNKNIDYKGQNFELVPFGSGRRICPGLSVAHRIVHLAVAALIHNFDWKFAPGESERNKEWLFGVALRREVPLLAIPMKL